jgi:acyl dehydratase
MRDLAAPDLVAADLVAAELAAPGVDAADLAVPALVAAELAAPALVAAARPRYDDVNKGTRLPALVHSIRRVDLVRYAGASGDFNVIHWSDRVASAAGLPGVIAHGMLTLGVAVRLASEWSGDPAAVVRCGGRFAKVVPVPDDMRGVDLVVEGVVAEKLDRPRVKVELTVRCAGVKVLTRCFAVVALD